MSRYVLSILLGVFHGCMVLGAKDVVSVSQGLLVHESNPVATIVIAKDAPEYTLRAARSLAHYVGRIAGAELPIATAPEQVSTAGIVWVGFHPALAARYPNEDFTTNNPEEILIRTIGADVVILGRDVVAEDGTQTEAGTHHAVFLFIEEQLGVRWFWPGKLGMDIPQQQTIRIAPVSIRYTPQLRLREFRILNFERSYNNALEKKSEELISELSRFVENPREWSRQKDRDTLEWLNFHRSSARYTGAPYVNPLAGSWSMLRNSHQFSGWYLKYGKEHPEWFAMQPDGTRQEGSKKPYPNAKDVKMCPSNMEIAEQWLKNAKELFKNNPHAISDSASEGDYGWQGYCVCEACLALDNKEGEILERPIMWKNESRQYYSLTDRYVPLWNTMARGLREEFPDRDLYVTVYAYHVTRPGPTRALEKNIIPIFVGLERRFYNRNSMEHTMEQREMWRKWWEATGRENRLVWRPNMSIYNAGLPYIFTRRHADNMRFMADHGMVGMVNNSMPTHWSNQGPQLYLITKLIWDPRADREAILSDYYARAFGPAAPYIEQYYDLFEELYQKLAEQYKNQGFSTYRDPVKLFREIRLDDQPSTGRLGREGVTPHRVYETKAEELLHAAAAAVENSEEKYRQRVEFIWRGFEFTQAQLECMEATGRYRENPSEENKAKLIEAIEHRRAILAKNANDFTIDVMNILKDIERGPQDLGSPSVLPTPPNEKDEQKEIQKLEA